MFHYVETRYLVYISKMFEKHKWKSDILSKDAAIVGKGGHNPPFLDQPTPPFLRLPLSRNPRCPHLHRSLRKTKVLNNSCNQFVYHFYPQGILVLEECLQKW